mmetsp:Transcript_50063/g.106540  ORF Transcript_50063/g.106540 Transcript_50063/m.106540 type:complete len:608 (+) Transcript_50063:129-1952(+)|eukprot:CAMPEP_0172565780 /NCGR_PEP_ID=MMETSP1067-20121228/109508_1 /TAXON_ID=265564 ORGANISM="Thalassiosira punctigera, Strain Tpunct2005C2" /NCGR_SAMPLE_ID=MMETSP1067 /ASSEMBLY_ACC=CAM_ASM_000444 /LENGTH=607 /DNA_ID=CAMNT_0013356743 /DNA_START=53 /DNA_END=1876 /DNA_ORIENTATION=-
MAKNGVLPSRYGFATRGSNLPTTNGAVAVTSTIDDAAAADGERRPLLASLDADKERWRPRAVPDPPRYDAKKNRCDDGAEGASLLRDEAACMTRLAVPVVLTYLLEMLPRMFTIVLVGRVGYDDGERGGGVDDGDGGAEASMQKLHLDAASLAVMFTNVAAMAPAIGLMSAMDTLCSQAHGARQPERMGTYFLTGLVVALSVFLIGSILIWNTSSILINLGQPTEVSKLAGDFARVMLPGVPFIYLYELIRKVLQARNETAPMLVAAVVSNVINVVLGYCLVRWSGWGWIGAAAARTIGNFTLIPSVLAGILFGSCCGGGASDERRRDDKNLTVQIDDVSNDGLCSLEMNPYKEGDGKQCDDADFLHHLWKGFVFADALSAGAFIDFLSLGFPGMLQVMLEWTAFEVIALLCGILPGREAIVGIGANSIINNVSSLTFMFYLGVSVSGNVRIGNALGAGDIRRAEIASKLTLVSGAVMAAISVVLLLAFRKSLPLLFTTDLDIVEKAQHVFLVATAFQLPDAVNAATQGIFRGSGRQALGAKVNLVAYYVISIPLGYILGVRLGLGVEGLWLGMTVGLCAIAIGCTMVVLQSDWNKLASEAASRLNR